MIEPSELVEPVEGGLTVKELRSGLRAMVKNVDSQRVEKWLAYRMAAPDEREGAREKYGDLCREQARLLAAVEEWEAAHPKEGEG